jgi:hypothetical protein
MGIVLVVTLAFALPDVDAALADGSGYPFLYALSGAVTTTGSCFSCSRAT